MFFKKKIKEITNKITGNKRMATIVDIHTPDFFPDNIENDNDKTD